MKTTVDLPETLVRSAKLAAVQRRTTLRQMVENGLKRELASQDKEPPRHPLLTLSELGKKNWTADSGDDFVAEQRAHW
jgi:hypothetical protein